LLEFNTDTNQILKKTVNNLLVYRWLQNIVFIATMHKHQHKKVNLMHLLFSR